MIVIDPRYNDTAAGREDEWLPIRPGTDGALAAAIAWVLITEDLIDKPFLDKYCIGYDETTLPASAPRNAHYKAYILGQGDDGIAKRRNGPRRLPVFRRKKSFNWRGKSARRNRLTFARAGDRNATLTGSRPHAQSPCCLYSPVMSA